MKRTLILTIAGLLASLTIALAQQPSIPVTVINGKQYYQYQVQPKETIYGLSKRFGITQEELIGMNPFLAAGMQIGQILTIPVVPGVMPAPAAQPQTATVTAAQSPQPASAAVEIDEKEGDEYMAVGTRTYQVTRRKEKLKDISTWENVSIDDIKRLNPGVPNVLKRGSELVLPARGKEAAATPQPTTAATTAVQAEETEYPVQPDIQEPAGEPVFLPDDQYLPPVRTSKDHVKTALLLPLMLGDSTSQPTERYIEFYEGVLLAVDTLKSLGFSTDMAVYDIGTSLYRLQQTLKTHDLSAADYVIAAANADQMPFLSEWARVNQVKLILPFSSRIQETAGNPYIYQVNPPQQLTHNRLLSGDTAFFRGKNIVFVRTYQEDQDERYSLFQGLKRYLAAYGIPTQEVYEYEEMTAFADTLNAHLSRVRDNLIIPAPTSMSGSNRLISTIASACNARPTGQVCILGYPEWIALSKNNLPLLYSLNAVIYGNFYADFGRDDVRAFQLRYSLTFGKDILNTYPRYSMMGYDITLQLANLFCGQQYSIRPLQHCLDFVQPDATGGWYNRNVYIIRHTADRHIESSLLK